MEQARTRTRVIRIASEQGWDVSSPTPSSLRLERGEAKIWLWFTGNGSLKSAMYHRPGYADKPGKGKLAYVVSWLTRNIT